MRLEKRRQPSPRRAGAGAARRRRLHPAGLARCSCCGPARRSAAPTRLLLQGGFGSVFAWSETLTRATPLILTGLAAAVAFRARLFNIGAEGQLYAGALAAVAVGGLHGGTRLRACRPGCCSR